MDHINGNTLDNRKKNLRLCTNQQNVASQHKLKKNESGFKGISKNKIGIWRARLRVNYKEIYIGSFHTAKEAAEAYDKAAIKYFGEFALTNKMMGLL